MFINKAYRIGEVILFVNKAKNTGIATLWRVFLTKLTSKRTRLNVMFISEQTLTIKHPVLPLRRMCKLTIKKTKRHLKSLASPSKRYGVGALPKLREGDA